MTIPVGLLRVLGNEHARALLVLLAGHDTPLRYSAAREALDLHPQAFQRALDRLEAHGLVGLRAPADLNRPHARTYHVLLEATALGTFLADFWNRMEVVFTDMARRQRGSKASFAAP